ncbi:MAG TPA: LysR substrate-binding domain-containing protein [Burkholderiaceae bacterium]|nr:LysR substrate-binding domain-containing protein [Burkholderiaceae bacterium]
MGCPSVVTQPLPRLTRFASGTPRPPEATDIYQKRLFEDSYAVFCDAAERGRHRNADEYLAGEHATVVYEPRRALDIDDWLRAQGVHRRVVVSVPGMGGLGPMVCGSRLLATAPSLLSQHALRGLAHAGVPLPTPAMPMYMVWHRRHQADPVQRWLREQLQAVVAEVLG